MAVAGRTHQRNMVEELSTPEQLAQSLVRQGLKAMLSLEPDLEVVGMADNGEAAIGGIETIQADVVLMDMRMPVMNGITATRILRDRFPDTESTVKTHLTSIFNRLNLKNRSQLAIYANSAFGQSPFCPRGRSSFLSQHLINLYLTMVDYFSGFT